jgi:hypothetical protein
VRAAIGGLASVAGGGKFGNGAVTAAFGYLFNDALHDEAEGSDEPWYKRINEQHRQGVEQAIAQYESQGFAIVGTEVRIAVPEFEWPRIYDFLAQAGENIFGIEVKTTIGESITLDTTQVAKDIMVVRRGGTILSGGTLTQQFRGQVIHGVGYATTCFGCQTLNVNSLALSNSLRASGVNINRCDTAGACAIGGK